MKFSRGWTAFGLGAIVGVALKFDTVLSMARASTPSSSSAPSLVQEAPAPRPAWLLGSFLELAERQPARLVRITEMLFAPDRMRLSKSEPQFAFEWQHRLAAVSALSQIFDPSRKQRVALGTDGDKVRGRARAILRRALEADPSLLVRDGAVEAVRRMIRMNRAESKHWASSLEAAFVDERNAVDGEGLFIRETILTALREGSLPLTRRVRRSAEGDENPQVRYLVRDWSTSAYDSLE